ncbi:MAG TPA: GGDEF domain-containing phosphodiesterase [Burkholderiales bacterium]|nr:GGDEF domain-containing phosphodiesterase [Burkholderiales bacterium]
MAGESELDAPSPDRNPVVDRLQVSLSEAERAGESVGLLLVHAGAVDRIDALHGFHAGDTMSNAIAQTLRTKALRKRDLIEPIGRDEFACVLRPAPSEGIAMLAANRVMSLLALPMTLSGIAVTPDAAVGIAMFPEQADDAGQLLQRAKSAVHEARGRRERIWLYQPPAGETAAFDQLQYENRLRQAIDQNALALYYQPQLDMRTGRVGGAEALLRWHDEVLGTVPPHLAVRAAESAGLIDHLTMWVITSAIQACREFQQIEPDFTVSINISPSNLREADLPYYVDRALRTWNVRGSSIVIEITETAMMVDRAVSHEALRQLKSLGVKISVDDFGTGYSSMQYLAQLPLDELKIDLSFVRAMLEQPQNAKIVRSLIDLAHNLELKVVAEGVENPAILSALNQLGCDHAQGYDVGRPAPAQVLLERLQAFKAARSDDQVR